MRVLKSAFSAIIILAFAFPITSLAEEATSYDTKQTINEKSILDGFELESGLVDLKKLPVDIQKEIDERNAVINQYFDDLNQLQVKINIMKKSAKDQSLTANELEEYNSLNSKFNYLDGNSLQIAGLEKIENEPSFDIASDSGDVDVANPTLYYDNWLGTYVMYGTWEWNWEYGYDADTGGPDGAGLRVSQEKISIVGYGLTTYDNYGDSYYHSGGDGVYYSSYGVGKKFQDQHWGGLPPRYSAHRGYMTMNFRFYNGDPVGKTVNFNTIYAHTYESTSVTGFSIGENSFGISWSNDSYKWTDSNGSYKSF